MSPFKIGLFILLFPLSISKIYCRSLIDTNINVVKPIESFKILNNPGIGFVTYQRFNGDTLQNGRDWTEGDGLPINYQTYRGTITNTNYPQTTLAYWRIYWKYLQPEIGVYRWDLIDQALDSASRRGQKLIIRIAPHGPDSTNDVPRWYRNMVGYDFNFHNKVNNKWAIDYQNSNYIKYFGGLIKRFAKRYDGNPNLESVDLAIIGAWGEGEGSELLSTRTRNKLINVYLHSFKNTKLIALLTDSTTNRYIVSKNKYVGWRADCLGDLGIWAKEQNGWSHMYDWYPQAIIQSHLTNRWKTAPVYFEICRTFWDWKHIQKYTYGNVKFIFDQALKWHISTFNPKSSAIPEEWIPLLNEWLLKMGYRYVLRRISYNYTINNNRLLKLETWWENKGVAPCYDDFCLAIRLIDNKNNRSAVINTHKKIKTWLPGDILYNSILKVPNSLPKAVYKLEIGIVNSKNIPVVQLAIENKTDEGWYEIGNILIN